MHLFHVTYISIYNCGCFCSIWRVVCFSVRHCSPSLLNVCVQTRAYACMHIFAMQQVRKACVSAITCYLFVRSFVCLIFVFFLLLLLVMMMVFLLLLLLLLSSLLYLLFLLLLLLPFLLLCSTIRKLTRNDLSSQVS